MSERPGSRRALFLTLALAAGVLIWLLWSRSPGRVGEGPASHPPDAPRTTGLQTTIPGIPVAPPPQPGAAEAPSHLADNLNSPVGDIHADLRILDDIFQQYRSSLHEMNPVGDNVEITAALTGRNRLGFAFIPSNHPAINSRGELCDRWGNPFFFHQLSGAQMEIRSSGPDGKRWTADDEVITPGIYAPQK